MAGLPPRQAGRPGPHEQPTREDLKGLRRWVLVAGVWAVAATAIALIALLDDADRDAQKQAGAATSRLARTERKLDARLDGLERRLEALPRSEDVSRLQERLTRAESDGSKAAEGAKGAEQKVTDLEDRVQTLEDSAESDTGGTSTGPDQP